MVGVILNLAVWFGMHVLFNEVRAVSLAGLTLDLPVASSVDLPSLLLTIAAAVTAFAFKLGVIPLMLGCALAGLALHGAGLLI